MGSNIIWVCVGGVDGTRASKIGILLAADKVSHHSLTPSLFTPGPHLVAALSPAPPCVARVTRAARSQEPPPAQGPVHLGHTAVTQLLGSCG